MRISRLRDELLIGSVFISIAVAFASMLSVSVLIRHQYLEQSNATLTKAARIVGDHLADHQKNLLAASRQLATQKNLGSTLWYLSQYTQTGLEREALANTYRQLARDVSKIGRVAKLSRIAIYGASGNLISFAQSEDKQELVGYVEHHPAPLLMQVSLKEREELIGSALRETKAAEGFKFRFDGNLPQQETANFSLSNGKLAIESHVPIMGVAFDQATGKQEVKQLGLVASTQLLDNTLVEYLSGLTDLKINFFAVHGLSSGNLTAYAAPDWGGGREADPMQSPGITFNETVVDGEGYYQCLTPVYADKRLIGSIAMLQSKELVRKNTTQMVRTLGLIAIACLLLILPLAWIFASTVSRPLTKLSQIFRSVARGEQSETLNAELLHLEQGKQRHDELNDLTQGFITMNRAVLQKIEQINEINASLEQAVAQRTSELRVANEELSNLASHDTLTGLPNRKLLADRLQLALASARRNGSQLALMFIDLDDFKPINDTLGHDLGDQLLKEAALRIQASMRESDTVARFGGDEFIILLPSIASPADALTAAEKIRSAISLPFVLAGEGRHISASIGIALFPEHGSDENSLLKSADAAMYQAKNAGRNMARLFSAID